MCGLNWLDGVLLYAVLFWIVWFVLGGIWVGTQRVWTGQRPEGRWAEVRAGLRVLFPALALTLLVVYAVACYHRVDQLPRETADSWRPFAISVVESAPSSLPRRSLGP